MSVAFMRDSDETLQDELPDRPVSPYRNLVTARGLALIEAEVNRLQHDWERLHERPPVDQTQEEKAFAARAARDLRYWTSRRSTAELVPPNADTDQVHFGSRVTILRPDRGRRIYRIVGEDEADPAQGLISHVSPLAKALMGRRRGDSAPTPAGEVEIEDIG